MSRVGSAADSPRFSRDCSPPRRHYNHGTAVPCHPEAHSLDLSRPADRRLTAEYIAARALVDAATFDEAAPRILAAICETLEWEYGAFWSIDRKADALRCEHIWTAPAARFHRIRRDVPVDDLRARRGSARTRLGDAANRPGYRTSRPTRTFRARQRQRAAASTARSDSRSFAAAKCSASWSSSAARFARQKPSCWRCWRPSATRSACSWIVSGRRKNCRASSCSRWTCSAWRDTTDISNASTQRGRRFSATTEEELLSRPYLELHPSGRSDTPAPPRRRRSRTARKRSISRTAIATRTGPFAG